MADSKRILVYINGESHQVDLEKMFMSLSSYLREERGLVGTKVVCSEGDCGACTVLVSHPLWGKKNQVNNNWISINSCIHFMLNLDGAHIVTVEGLSNKGELNVAQKALVDGFGTQCGFCTPGIVMALTGHLEAGKELDQRRIKNSLTGNLCRCTGYKSILESAEKMDASSYRTLNKKYDCEAIQKRLEGHLNKSAEYQVDDLTLFAPLTMREATEIKKKHPEVLLFSGGSDLGVLFNKGKLIPQKVLYIGRISELYNLTVSDECDDDVSDSSPLVSVGARVTYHMLLEYFEAELPEFVDLIHVFASPQIKNQGTIVGNVANASPIGDTIPFLFVVGAEVVLNSSIGERRVSVEDFYLGYKTLDLRKDELISRVEFRLPRKSERTLLYKTSQRRDLDISCVTLGVSYQRDDKRGFDSLKLAIGGVGATVHRLPKTESLLLTGDGSFENFERAAEKIVEEIAPLSDVRGSKSFRKQLSSNMIRRFYFDISGECES